MANISRSKHLQIWDAHIQKLINNWLKIREFRSFEVFNADGTKNREVTRVAFLEVKINGYKEQLEVVVMDFNSIDMFLGYDWLVKHNPEVNWKDGKIQFTRCLGFCRMKHKDIEFKTRRIQTMENTDKDNGEIGKEPDTTNPEDLPDYI